MSKELVSVIIPVYNGEKYIAEAIQSVLNQSHSHHEIIVVDDGSTDNSAAIVKRFPVNYFYQENKGQAVAINFGLSQATGDFTAFLDCDDLWSSEKSKIQLETLRDHPNVDAVFGRVQQFKCPTLSKEEADQLFCPDKPMNGMSKVAMLIRSTYMKELKGFDDQSTIGDFIEWFSRASQAGFNYKSLDQVVAKRRIHTQNMSVTNREGRTAFAQILKRHLDQKRSKQ